MNYVKKQHYIPQFILRNFADSKGRVRVIDKFQNKSYLSSPEKVFCENNLYEIRNLDNSYFRRNELEQMFSRIESSLSQTIRILLRDQNTGRYLTKAERLSLTMLLVQQMLRMPDAIQIIRRSQTKSKHTENDHIVNHVVSNALELLRLRSSESSLAYLQHNGVILSEEHISALQRDPLLKSMLIRFCGRYEIMPMVTTLEKPFMFPDTAYLSTAKEDVPYVYIVSPTLAFSYINAMDAQPIAHHFANAGNELVDTVNLFTYTYATRYVVCKP